MSAKGQPQTSEARIIAAWYKHHTNKHRHDCRDCAALYRAALADMLKVGKAHFQRMSSYDKRPARTRKRPITKDDAKARRMIIAKLKR